MSALRAYVVEGATWSDYPYRTERFVVLAYDRGEAFVRSGSSRTSYEAIDSSGGHHMHDAMRVEEPFVLRLHIPGLSTQEASS